ncbi:MarR family winged helix-turn-helix transcriptional regulator [Cellulomonas sp. PhB143]|uniref:MarR family winged helix-turn-helix transcriptional regulator n=1 Tax=Cellulomonas sp. PhB143 TaxID=2485186 RepID=UPI000F49F06C|nr:MarR family winged helix-turn-helix transcriptional regulator [Cellulomonas sp. PhB143]ROS76684.1 MarR family transcriptional regulator [Cellulomonas sp. PhB143]
MSTVWLDADQQLAWRRYLEGRARLHDAIGREHDAHLSVSLEEYEVLVRLSESPTESVRMSSLADGLAHSRSRTTHTVRRMEDRGLVRRGPVPGDRRGVLCTLTEEGRRTLVAEAPAHVAAVRRYLVDVLTPDQLRTLGEAMDAVTARCREDGVC